MIYEISQIDDILNNPKKKIWDMFSECDTYLQDSQELIKDYNIVNDPRFNVFSSISDIYHRENYHSDIIKLILDPSTEKIGNENNIQLFIKFLEKVNSKLNIKIGENVTVERESGYIDILLYDENKNAIIIENKINFARDQDDQISRYYNYATTERGLNVNAIVYLTLTPEKVIDITHSIKNKKEREKIKKILVPVSAISNNKEINFSTDFIDECIKYSKNDISRVYYSEYKELIIHLGGNVMKKTGLYRDAITDVYTDKEKLKAFNLFGELWDNRYTIIRDIVKELLEKNDFQNHPDYNGAMYCKIDDDVSLGFYIKNLSVGFIYTPGTKKFTKMQEELKNILNNKKMKDIFYKIPVESDSEWVWKTIDIDKIGGFENIVDNFRILKELYHER
jgi:hypothetical protein